MSVKLEGSGDIVGFIQFWMIVRGLFIAGVILTVLFAGEPSLLEAIIAWIGRH